MTTDDKASTIMEDEGTKISGKGVNYSRNMSDVKREPITSRMRTQLM